jgi:hypothetical protein
MMTNVSPETVAAALRALRAAGVRPSEVAALLGRSRMSVYNWFSGTHPPSRDIAPTLVELARRAHRLRREGVLPARFRRAERRALLRTLLNVENLTLLASRNEHA